MLAAVKTVVISGASTGPRRVSSFGFMGPNLTLSAAPPPRSASCGRVGRQRFVDMALSELSEPSAFFVITNATESPAASGFDTAFISVTGVLGGTVMFCEPPAYCTTRLEPLVLLTLPFDIRDWVAVPLVMRDCDTLPLVIRLAAALVFGAIMRLPSPSPRRSSGKMWISVARSDPSDCFTVVTPTNEFWVTCDRSL